MARILSRYFGPSAVKYVSFEPKLSPLRNCEARREMADEKCTKDAQCAECLPYRIRSASWRDHNDILNFMASCYFKHEPVMIGVGLDKRPAPLMLMKMIHDNLKHGMSLIAETVDDECLVGAAVNVPSGPLDVKRLNELAECCGCGPVRQVIEFFAHLAAKPNLWERFCVQQIFECSYLAVDPEYQGRGIGRHLLQQSWLLARDCGYRLFRIDCTSRYSAKIAASYNWQCVCTIPYCRYVKNGEIVFKNIQEPHTEVLVYVDRVKRGNEPYPPYKKDMKEAVNSKSSNKNKRRKKKR